MGDIFNEIENTLFRWRSSATLWRREAANALMMQSTLIRFAASVHDAYLMA